MKIQRCATLTALFRFGNYRVDVDLAEIVPTSKIMPVKCTDGLKRRHQSLPTICR